MNSKEEKRSIDWVKGIVWLIILFGVFMFWLGFATMVFAVEQTIDVPTNPFASVVNIEIPSFPQQVIEINYNESTYFTGLGSILALENVTTTQLNINVVNVSDGLYIDVVRVNNSVDEIVYTFTMNVTAGFLNQTERFAYTIASLPWNITENMSITIAAGRQINVTYDQWLTGEAIIDSSETGTTTIPVRISIPESVSPGTYFRYVTLQFDEQNLHTFTFKFDVLDIVEPCRDLRPTGVRKPDEELEVYIARINSEYILYNTCLQDHKPTIIINTTTTVIIPGDLQAWLADHDAQKNIEIASKDSLIAANGVVIDELRKSIEQLQSEASLFNSTIEAKDANQLAQLSRIDAEQVSKWWYYIFWIIIIINVAGYIMVYIYQHKVM